MARFILIFSHFIVSHLVFWRAFNSKFCNSVSWANSKESERLWRNFSIGGAQDEITSRVSSIVSLCHHSSNCNVSVPKLYSNAFLDFSGSESVKVPVKHSQEVAKFLFGKFPSRLTNGTLLKREYFSPSESVIEVSGENSEAEFLNKNEKNITVSSQEDSIYNESNKKIDENKSRVIAVNFRKVSPLDLNAAGAQKKNISSTVTSHPKIRLAQIVRGLIYPDWFWKNSFNRKTGLIPSETQATNVANVVGATKYSKGNNINVTKPTKAKLPSLTWDNNFSRFMKLFTLVRFENTACVTETGMDGVCYHSRECAGMGGVAGAPCAGGFGVCCVFQVRCGQATSVNETYFTSDGVTFGPTASTCVVHIQKANPNIKQFRLDLNTFTLMQPSAGDCNMDRFVVSGQNTNNIIPILCGENSGSHMYVETEGLSTGIVLSILTTGEGSRSWTIRITQYATDNLSSPPSFCLQYYTGVTGMIRSFNYMATFPQYLNNLNYAICIRKEAGFCSATFSNTSPDNTPMTFRIINANENGASIIPEGQAGIGIRDCPFDFVNVNGYRLCGDRFNDGSNNPYAEQDAPVTDINSGPFIVTVNTDNLDVSAGFNLFFQLNPCRSTPG